MKKSMMIIGGIVAVSLFALFATDAAFMKQASDQGVLEFNGNIWTGLNPDCIYAGVRIGSGWEIRSLCWIRVP